MACAALERQDVCFASSVSRAQEWQQLRQARVAESVLVQGDRSTALGLKTPGARTIESILLQGRSAAGGAAVAAVRAEPKEGTPEWALLDACRNPRNWV